MFGRELVPPARPSCTDATPHVREFPGSHTYSHGIIAKQPGSDWHHRKHAIERQRMGELKMISGEGMKDIVDQVRKRKFEQKTGRRNFLSRLQVKVKEGLLAAEEDLQKRKNLLRDLLLHEESEYTRECVEKSQAVQTERVENIKKHLEEIKLKNAAEQRQFVEEKRLQQYMLRCEELRNKMSEYNRQHIHEVHLRQMEEKLAKTEAERERDMLYCKLMEKNIQAMNEYEMMSRSAKHSQMKEMAEIYTRQLEGKKLLEEEEKRVKEEEAKLILKIQEEIAYERKEGKLEEMKKREKMREEMLEQVRNARELLEMKKKQELEMDRAFCKLIQVEIEREKALQTDTKVQNRHELELFQEHLNRMRKQRQKDEKESELLREQNLEKILNMKEEMRCNALKAKEKLAKDTVKQQGLQMEENKRKLEEELERKRIEDELELRQYEKFKEDEKIFQHEMAMKKKMMAKELRDQIETSRILREKEAADEEARCKAQLMEEEQYIRKIRIPDTSCKNKHPFVKKLEGSAT